MYLAQKEFHECEICGAAFAEKHHIVFRSQGGLDFPLNYKYLCSEDHKGNKGPHMCKETNIKYKLRLQEKLFNILNKKFYSEDDVINLLELKKKQADKIFKRFILYPDGYSKEEIIRRLMGGKLYLKEELR